MCSSVLRKYWIIVLLAAELAGITDSMSSIHLDGTKSVIPNDQKVNTRFVAGLGLGEGHLGRQDRGEFSGFAADSGLASVRGGGVYRGFSGDEGGGRYSGYGGYEYTGTEKIRHKQSEMKHNRRARVEPRFETGSINNTLVIARIGERIDLNCRIFMIQDSTVSWAVERGATIDLLTVGNTTFTGDIRYSINMEDPHDWALRIERVEARDAGKFICSLQTFPKQTLIIYLQVEGPIIEIKNSSEGFVYSAGSHISLQCVYRNKTKWGWEVSTTPHPLLPVPVSTELPRDAVRWTLNNKTFSLRNRKRVRNVWTGEEVTSHLSIKSSIQEDSGNYSCSLPNTDIHSTVQIIILKGEHSEAVHREPATSSSSSRQLRPSSILTTLFLFTLSSTTLLPFSFNVIITNMYTLFTQ